ncbi:MAG: DMT family transporter [Eubacteriaceae bacterium]|nr:DMT family transporter [Eubacteriaceae bacterium]
MNAKKGAIITLTAGILWGFSGCCGQYIFENFDADPTYLTSYRMFSAGIILTIIGFIKSRDEMVAIWHNRGQVIRLFLFAWIGVMFNMLSYLSAIAYSNSGTATILQYIGPVLVMIYSCFAAHQLPKGKEVLAIVMAMLGTFILATHGNIHTMMLTPLGLTWGLLAAFALACYNIIPGDLIHIYGAIPITGYGMLIGGGTLFTLTRSWNAPMIYDPRCIAAFVAMVIVGTVLTFTMYLLGVKLIGPVKASLLACIEPVSAVVIMVIWLKESFQFLDFVGFMCIFVTVFLLTKKEEAADSAVDR